MKKTQTLTGIIAAFAFTALTVASASATLWLQNGKSLVMAAAANAHGSLLIHHIKIPVIVGGGEFTIHCTGLSHGTVGPGAQGLLELFLGLSGEREESSCEVAESTNTICPSRTLVTIQPDNLPWKTLLVLEGTLTVKYVESETAGREPGWETTCKTLKVLCSKNGSSHFDENLTNGALFLSLGTGKESCGDGAETTILGMYEVLGFTVS